MPCLLKGLIQQQDQRRQYGDAAQHAQKDALGHDDAQVAAHGKGHEAEGNEAGHSGHRAADHAGDGLVDGHGHRLIAVRNQRALLGVAVPEEDGVIHGDRQLQHG